MRILVVFTLLLSSLLSFAGEKKTEVFTLDHQMKEQCKKRITEKLRYEKGITKIVVSLKKNTITITYDADKTNPQAIIRAFKKIGFNAVVYKEEGMIILSPIVEGTEA